MQRAGDDALHLTRREAVPSAVTEDLLEVLEEMTMLDTTVQRRISILVYSDLETAYDYLVRVFGQPYGYREYSARDSEGGLWSFMKPLD
jgi:hypothetical protein